MILNRVDSLTDFFKDALSDDVYYDRRVKRYRYKDSQQFAPRRAVLSLQQRYLIRKQDELVSFAERARKGDLIARDTAKTLKDIHISNAIIEAGGSDRLTQSMLGKIGAILKNQYYQGKDPITGKRYGLKYLLQDAPNQSQKMVEHRLRQFVKSGEITRNVIREEINKNENMTHSIRRLGAVIEHCPSCLRYAGLGVQPIGVLPVPKTDCECNVNCACSIEYLKNPNI